MVEQAGLFAASSPASEIGDGQDDEDAVGAAPLRASDVVLEDSFASRRDSLLRTVPLHDVVERVRRTEELDPAFDARALCLAAFDAVIARQGFPDSATVEDVITVLTEVAGIQAPASTPQARTAVAEAVLDGLMNRKGRNRRFELETVAYSRDRTGAVRGTAVQQQFWLLRAIEDPATGRVTLEASADAVNMLVGGLNIPIADNQRAAQIMLALQLERGDIAAAASTAARNRTLTVGYLNETDELLRRTAQYVAGAGWDDDASERLDAALTHLQTCLAEESRALSHVRQGRDDDAAGAGLTGASATGSPGGAGTGRSMDARRRARYFAQLTQLLEESRSLHTALLERVIGARTAFLAAQDAQLFRPALTTFDLDLTADLLTPVLALDLAAAEQVLDTYLVAELGPYVPRVVNWGDLVDALLSRRDPERAEHEPASDVAFRADPEPLVNAALVSRTRKVVTAAVLPCRLSTLLAACPDEGHDGAQPHDIVIAAALRAYDVIGADGDSEHPTGGMDAVDRPSWRASTVADPARLADALARKALAVLGEDAVCLDDGTQLTDPFVGADLLVCADRHQAHEVFLGALATPAPTVLTERSIRSQR